MAWALSVEIDDIAKFGQFAYSNEIGNNNNNKQICIAPWGRNFRGADELPSFLSFPSRTSDTLFDRQSRHSGVSYEISDSVIFCSKNLRTFTQINNS